MSLFVCIMIEARCSGACEQLDEHRLFGVCICKKAHQNMMVQFSHVTPGILTVWTRRGSWVRQI